MAEKAISFFEASTSQFRESVTCPINWEKQANWNTADVGLQKAVQDAWKGQQTSEGRPPLVFWQTGSHAYGIADQESDLDIKGVWSWNLDQMMSLIKWPDSIDIKEPDMHAFEIKKFVRLAAQSNPNMIELLFAPVIMTWNNGDLLLKNKHLFLTTNIADVFGHFSRSQLHELANKFTDNDTAVRKRKKAVMHILRTLENAEGFLLGTKNNIRANDPENLRWWSTQPFAQVQKQRENMLQKVEEAKHASHLPKDVDWNKINFFVVDFLKQNL